MVKAATEAATAASGGTGEMIGKVVKVTGAAAAKGGEEKSVNGIASGIKGIVAAAEKAGEEGKLESEAAGAAGEANEDAGKLFAAKNANAANGGGGAGDAEKAAAAVSAVSGKQILKAIVDAAGKEEKKGAKAEEATNPIAAAIGSTGEKAAAAVSAVSGKQILKAIVDAAGKEEKKVADVKDATNPIAAAIGSTGEKAAAAFNQDGMKKNDQIAAAIVLRGMAKDGEFALKNDADAEKGLKSTVESAVNKTVADGQKKW